MTRPLPAQRAKHSITAEERECFLARLAHGWSVTHAAQEAGHARQRFYELRDEEKAFADQWAHALDAGTEVLEDEARRRAVDGYDEETFDAEGRLLRRVRRYDGALLQLLLRGRRPEKYRDNASVEVQTPAVFVLESAFGEEEIVEGEATEEPGELEAGES